MKVIEHHEHPLKLIDLQLEYEEEEEEEDDEGGDQITKEGFHGVKCSRCHDEIHMYHRYYYKCSSCHFSLHKFCAELPSKVDHPSDSWPLTLVKNEGSSVSPLGYHKCCVCDSDIVPWETHYKGLWSRMDVKCAVEVGKNIIYHPCHPHSLMCAISKPILSDCNACGKRHEGIFYQCSTICTRFIIHIECAFLPETLLIQQRTKGAFYHTHPLTISYSFPWKEQDEKHRPQCRVCGKKFDSRLWIYRCDKCLYYVHVYCATSRRESFMSIFLPGKNIKNFEDADHPHLLHLPFPDETYSIPRHLFFQTGDHKVNLKHMSHEHPLILVDVRQASSSKVNSLLLMCHDPMKKTQLLCNGCLRPIMSTMLFYKCVEHCNFVLHEWCTRLPKTIEKHPLHPQHTLALMYSNVLPFFFSVFHCLVCHLPCNGFAYCCVECGLFVDVCCGFIPKEITHEAHPDHLLSIFRKLSRHGKCHLCLQTCSAYDLSFHCKTCDIYVHPECALLSPKEIRHRYDKHPMHLSYLPIENHKNKYFCEICEEDLNPHRAFYHCHDCVQSVHAACAPSILQSETETRNDYKGHPSLTHRRIHYFINVKFQGIDNTNRHPHPLSFVQGTVLDGQCSNCNTRLQYKMMFKCLRCRFAVDYNCCMYFK